MKPRFRTLQQRYHQLMGSKTVIVDGVRLHAEADMVGPNVRTELIRGTYEFAERKLLASILRPNDRVLEIGAGVGAIGLIAARIVGDKNVTSYEANPDLAPILRGNYALNDLHPNLVMKAVTPEGGDVEFFVTESLLSSSLHDRGATILRTIESDPIDQALQMADPTVLILDVEGAEVTLLPRTDLSQVRALLIELHPNVVGSEAISQLEADLHKSGYKTARRLHRNILMTRT